MRNFNDVLLDSGQLLQKGMVTCLQMNLGYTCNLSCNHCHVEAGPHRHEQMNLAVVEDCLSFIKDARVNTVDITGGAPEMNPNLRYLITALRSLDFVERVLVRSNLSILAEDKYEDLPQFFVENKVDVIASLPCYLEENVTYQRGKGVYSKNIRMLQKLNRLGYGKGGLKLNLVYNPGGNFLPGPQQELERDYKDNLRQRFGIEFNSLYTITNMPIGRFRSSLEKQGLLDNYMKLLSDNFNSENLRNVMCRNLVNVDWQGRLYDCDFNHVLKLPVDIKDNYIGSIKLGDLVGRPIKCGSHCFTCVAGAGSSCQGSLKNKAV